MKLLLEILLGVVAYIVASLLLTPFLAALLFPPSLRGERTGGDES